jgi:hypothetical protein
MAQWRRTAAKSWQRLSKARALGLASLRQLNPLIIRATMTPEILASELRERLPHTEIVLGDKPGRVIVRMATGAYPLTVYIALSKSGDRMEIGNTDPGQRPRDSGRSGERKITTTEVMNKIERMVDDRTTQSWRTAYVDPMMDLRIRAWAQLPDMPPSVKDRARALLDSDRKAADKLREDLRVCEENIASLERALGEKP